MMGCVSVTYGETELGFEPLPHVMVLACYSLDFEMFHSPKGTKTSHNRLLGFSLVKTKYFSTHYL